MIKFKQVSKLPSDANSPWRSTYKVRDPDQAEYQQLSGGMSISRSHDSFECEFGRNEVWTSLRGAVNTSRQRVYAEVGRIIRCWAYLIGLVEWAQAAGTRGFTTSSCHSVTKRLSNLRYDPIYIYWHLHIAYGRGESNRSGWYRLWYFLTTSQTTILV